MLLITITTILQKCLLDTPVSLSTAYKWHSAAVVSEFRNASLGRDEIPKHDLEDQQTQGKILVRSDSLIPSVIPQIIRWRRETNLP